MSGLEERVGLRVQGVELKLEALANELKRLSENLGDVEKDNQGLLFLEPDIIKMLEAFWAREQEELNEGKEAVEGEGEAGNQKEEADDEFNVIPISTPGGTSFNAHWISVSDSTSYSSCDDVTSKDIAETVLLEASQKKISEGVDISNGDLLFLLCRPQIPDSDSEDEPKELCTYVGLYLDTAGEQDQEPDAGSGEELITKKLADGEEPIASVFVWEECVCAPKSDNPEEDATVEIPTVSVTSSSSGSSSSENFLISSVNENSGSIASFIGLGNYTVTPKISILANPNQIGGSTSSLSLAPVDDATLTNSKIEIFANKCGELDTVDNGESSSSEDATTSTVLQLATSASEETLSLLSGLSAEAAVSLGGGDIRAFIPLLSQSDASAVEESVESVAFAPSEETGLPIDTTTETENGVTTTTYTLHLASQQHYSGVTTQESPVGFDIVTQTLEADDGVGVDGSVTELEQVKITLEAEAVDSTGDSNAGVRYKLYSQYVTANNSYEKGRLKNFGNSVNQAKILLGEIVVPGTAAVYENLGVDGSLSLLGDYDVTMNSTFEEADEEGKKTAVHKIYKTKTTRANISWLDGILTGLGNDVKQENVLVGVIRVPDAPVAYGCNDSYQCVEDPGGEYDEASCGGGCPEPCTLEDPPSAYYVYVYNESQECWELESEHLIDSSSSVQNTDTTQHYSNYGRLDADCTYDPTNPTLTFYVGNQPVVEVANQKKLTNAPLAESELCSEDPYFTSYDKHVEEFGAGSTLEESIVFDRPTTETMTITIEFQTGVIEEVLEITGFSGDGQTATLLKTNSAVYTAPWVYENSSNAEDFNSKIYTLTIPTDTNQLDIKVTSPSDLGDYTNTGFNLRIYEAGQAPTTGWGAIWDYPGRIVWKKSGGSCSKYELTGVFTTDGFPNQDYFWTEAECSSS